MARRSFSSSVAALILFMAALCVCSGSALANDSVEITSPADSSVISGGTASFSWSANDVDVSRWSLWIGSTPGARDIYQQLHNGTSATVTGLPADGSTLYVRLYYASTSGWRLGDAHTYLNSEEVNAELLSPADGSTLSGTSEVFQWTANGLNIDAWALWVGTAPATRDIHSRIVTGTSVTVTGLPTDGSDLYVRLYSRSAGRWSLVNTYDYTAASFSNPEIMLPTENGVLTSSSETFSWTSNGTPIDKWSLWVGSSVGSRDLFNRTMDATSVTINNLPTDGSNVHARLFGASGGTWSLLDERTLTTASITGAELLAPASGTVLSGPTQLFEWAANDDQVDDWSLWVGSSNAQRDISNQITTGTSATVNNMPTDGSDVYVRLYARRDGAWRLIDSRTYATNAQVVEPGVDLSLYDLTFNDEFDGSNLNTNKWATAYYWGPFVTINAEEQYYVDYANADANASWSPFELNNGVLTITAIETDGVHNAPDQPAENSTFWSQNPEYQYNPNYDSNNANYLSGVIASHKSYSFTHGYAESRIKVPSGKGLWSAFWLHTFKYVEDSPEIDIMEHLGEPANKVHQTMHYFDVEDNWRLVSTPTHSVSEVDYSLDFHTYAVSWEPTKVDFFIDGELVHSVDDNNFVIAKQAMHVLTNLAVGGSWPGTPDANTVFPAQLAIDYVRVYQKKSISPITSQALASNYQLMFNEEFSGGSLDQQKWNTSYLWGPFYRINQEEQYYPDMHGRDSGYAIDPFNVSNGTLKITATSVEPNDLPSIPGLNDPSWAQYPSHQNNPTFGQPSGWTPNYVSGLITSYDNFKFIHGYVEANVKIPEGSGLWPAFWLLNGYYVGPQPEIDIMEARGGSTHEVHQSYHYNNNAGQLISTTSSFTNPSTGSKYSDDFHRYGVAWEPGNINWYIDGNIVHTVSGPHVSLQLAYVIANLAVGGNYVSDVDENALPATLEIDYIKVWQRK